MRIVHEESGQMVVISALSMTLLMGFMALALDVSLLFRAQRNAQIAADAAATAAVLDYHYNLSLSHAQTAGKTASSNNGITDGTNGNSVVINMPPTMGPNTAQTTFAEALISQPNPTYFMKLFGFGSVNVTARAVAGDVGGAKACWYVTNPTASGALSLKGAYSITGGTDANGNPLPACGGVVASTSSSAIKVTGNGGTVDTTYLATPGGYSGHDTNPTTISSGVQGLPTDPLANQVANQPQPPTCNQTSALSSITTANESTVQGSASTPVICFTSPVTIGNGVVFNGASGLSSTAPSVVYVFEQGVTIGVGSTVTFGSGPTYDATNNTFPYPPATVGATMEIYGGTLTQQSNSILNLYAPSSGALDAVAIWQPVANTNPLQVQFGSNNEVLDGFIYAPGANVTLHDNGGGVVATGLVANTLSVNSSSIRLPNYNTANAKTTPLTQIILVE